LILLRVGVNDVNKQKQKNKKKKKSKKQKQKQIELIFETLSFQLKGNP